MKRILTILLSCAAVLGTAQTKVSVGQQNFMLGEEAVVTATNIPDSTNIYIYQDAARLPLRWHLSNQSGSSVASAVITVEDSEPWKNIVRAEQDSGRVVLDSAVFYVNEEPVLPCIECGLTYKIWLMTDIHVMSPELVINDGKALQETVEADRKMLRQSAEIMAALTDSVIQQKPDLLLIAGDLTKDGEKVSHQLVASYLSRIQQAGTDVLVIPGNHDVKNPNAASFDGDNKQAAPHISEQEFAQIYKDFGYDENIYARDTSSLSYIAEPIAGICILGIDATRCRENLSTLDGDAQNKRVDYGRLRPETLRWLLDRADEATKRNRIVIAMMHHQLVEHFNEQATVLASAAIEQGDSIAEIFINHGIRLVLTGHMHITNATTFYNAAQTDSLVEISTGATVSYPVPYRVLTVNEKRDEIKVTTRNLHCLNTIPDLAVFSRDELSARMDRLMSSVANMFSKEIDSALAEAKSQVTDDEMIKVMVEKMESALPKSNSERALLAYRYFGEPFTLAMLTASEGNEDRKLTELLDPMIEQGVDSLMEYIIMAGDFEHTTFSMMGIPLTISTVEIVRLMGTVVKLMLRGEDDAINEYSGSLPSGFKSMLGKMQSAINRANTIKTSLLEDISYLGTEQENKTNDLFLNLQFPTPLDIITSVEAVSPETVDNAEGSNTGWFDLLGRQISEPTERGIYIHNGKTVIF